MKSNRWSVYKVKSKTVNSTQCHPKPSTAGKEALEIEKVGQSIGGRTKKPLSPSEHDMQVAVIDWCRAHEGRWPALRSLYAIPNGGHRHIATAKKLKKEGVRAGVPDLHLPILGGRREYIGLWIEMKAKGGRVSPAQAAWHKELTDYRHRVVVCWTAEDAIKAIKDYLEG